MLKTRATFKCKEPDLKPRECVIEKVITLSGTQYDNFAARMHLRYDFIRDNIDLMRCDSNDVYHCLLVVGEGREDGVLIQSEGADYARYSAFMPHAHSVIMINRYPTLINLYKRLEAAVEHIIREGTQNTTQGNWIVPFNDVPCEFPDEIYLMNHTIAEMLMERDEVSDLDMHDNCFDVCYYLAYCPKYEGPSNEELSDVEQVPDQSQVMEI